MLKLNENGRNTKEELESNSNTTIVKVKYKKTRQVASIYIIQIQRLLKLNIKMKGEKMDEQTYSNTTIVKVKYSSCILDVVHHDHSNTTIVKVKFGDKGLAIFAQTFKYNDC